MKSLVLALHPRAAANKITAAVIQFCLRACSSAAAATAASSPLQSQLSPPRASSGLNFASAGSESLSITFLFF